MVQYAYCFSTYGEHGAEYLQVSLTREKCREALGRVLRTLWAAEQAERQGPLSEDSAANALAEPLAEIERLFLRDDADLAADGKYDKGKFELTAGWGGYQLHVVEIT
jgi:hypothetical protein